jgi:hypothetical protein
MKTNLSEQTAKSIYPARLIEVPVAQPLSLAKGYWSAANELGYWRGWKELDGWMRELATEKVPGVDVGSGMPILLTYEDVERLRLEITFGDLWLDWVNRNLSTLGYGYGLTPPGAFWNKGWKDEHINASREVLFATLDKMQRVIRRNASIVHYVGSF